MLKKNFQIAIFLAARSGSKRLPNKHFLKVNSSLRMIDICILRLKKSKLVKNIFLCTTKKKEDDKFQSVCKKHNIQIFRGSTNDVAKRIIDCAKKNFVKIIVRITADCPIIDPSLVDKCIKMYKEKDCDYVSNTLKLSFPDGLDVEVINLEKLIKSQKLSISKYNKEHVTPFLRKSKKFKKLNYKCNINYSNRRWTLDEFDDFVFIKRVIKYFYPNIFFSWKKLIKAEQNDNSLINLRQRI